jgi:magnesium-transporting ATPase (P-type)
LGNPQSWHDQQQEQVLTELGATPAGLSDAEVERRIAQYGPNRLPEAPRRSVEPAAQQQVIVTIR